MTSSTAAATTSTPPISRLAVPTLAMGAFCSAISLRVTDALLPRLAGEFNVSLGEVSNVITFFAVAYGISQLFFGPLGDRFGKYLVVGWACLAGGITAALCGLAPSYPMLLVARLLAGGTAAAIIPLSMAWIGDVVPYEQRQPVLARFLIGQVIGLSSGVWVGGYAADHFSWRFPFFGIALAFLVTSVILLSINRTLPAHARKTTHGEGSVLRRLVSEFGQVLAKPWARVVLLSVFTEGAFVFAGFAFMASHLHHVHGISLSKAGSLVMLYGFGGMLFALTSHLLVSKLGEIGLTRWGGVVIASSFLIIAFAPAWWWAIPACFIAGLGFYMLHNTMQTNATQMAPERRGAAVASFASSFYLGQSVGVGTAGMLVERLGTGTIIGTCAIGLVLIGLNFSRLKKNHKSS